MGLFFDDIDAAHRFSLELDRHQNTLTCTGCSCSGQFVSHGFVYKKHSQGRQRTVGKRILCSSRCGRSGCGRTLRLYLNTELPRLQYTATHLLIFLTTLIAGFSIQRAYSQATSAPTTRNAYRWINKLNRKLMDYRNRLRKPKEAAAMFGRSRSRRLHILLITLERLSSILEQPLCQHYQQRYQSAFI
ncbi:hypothetical protein ACL7TT_09930 [Microbulbifer sp. 2304DJ12-6]|uniref:hypothetical protein n=1 Tax=Microbulbifer sp. 2304DJ12-6 TaxID=3233340 RepID=UPI0039AFC5A7